MALTLLLQRPGLQVAGDSALVKRDDWARVTGADEIFEHAQRCAQRMLESTREQMAQRGLREGREAAQQEAAQALAEIALARRASVEALAPLLTEIVMEALGTVLRRLGPAQRQALAVDALAEVLREARWARLRVPPAAVAAANEALDALARDSGMPAIAQVVADDSLGPDECVLDTDSGQADAGLPTQLAALRAAVAAAVAASVRGTA